MAQRKTEWGYSYDIYNILPTSQGTWIITLASDDNQNDIAEFKTIKECKEYIKRELTA